MNTDEIKMTFLPKDKKGEIYEYYILKKNTIIKLIIIYFWASSFKLMESVPHPKFT